MAGLTTFAVAITGTWTPLAERIHRKLAGRADVRLPAGLPGLPVDQRNERCSDGGHRRHGALHGTHAVIHVLPQARLASAVPAWEPLLTQAVEVARAAVAAQVETLVVTSSSLVYGTAGGEIRSASPLRPATAPGQAMLSAEAAMRSVARGSATRLVMARLPHVYGPESPLLSYIRRGSVPVAGDRHTVFSHIHVEDAARALIAATKGSAGEAFAISDHEPASWDSFLGFAQQLRTGLEVHWLPAPALERAGALLGSDIPALPSEITPGMGLGWRLEQRIDSHAVWAALGLEPIHGSYRSGLTSILCDPPTRERALPTRLRR